MTIITLTEAAATQITKSLQKRGSGVGVKIGVVNSGCTGKAYSLEYLDNLPEADSTDVVIEAHGAKVIVDEQSIVYITGMTVDYRTEGLQSGFKFDNPNVLLECGCGKSFSA